MGKKQRPCGEKATDEFGRLAQLRIVGSAPQQQPLSIDDLLHFGGKEGKGADGELLDGHRKSLLTNNSICEENLKGKMDGNVPLPPPPTTHIDGDRLLLNVPFPHRPKTPPPPVGSAEGGRWPSPTHSTSMSFWRGRGPYWHYSLCFLFIFMMFCACIGRAKINGEEK
ncbi:hypothetical protein niasHT_015506 [Heterodera trifolii]|uniref:Uncharacterized protein n=1 Tax=Heterodera trifolii TaxID=157864 RepID=A0ABD2L095_9BILA